MARAKLPPREKTKDGKDKIGSDMEFYRCLTPEEKIRETSGGGKNLARYYRLKELYPQESGEQIVQRMRDAEYL